MKALEAAAEPKRKNFEKPKAEVKKPSINDQVAALSDKFKVR
jgi:hypothetical protein